MASTRRDFVKLAAVVAACPGLKRLSAETTQTPTESGERLPIHEFCTATYRVQMAANQPGMVTFDVDSLGRNKLDGNIMLPLSNPSHRYSVSREHQTITYRLTEEQDGPAWIFEFGERGFVIRSTPSPKLTLQPLVLNFTLDSHATLLGLFSAVGTIHLPALLHIPHH
jgi:hypothetical protein